jgi:hypothetical protein
MAHTHGQKYFEKHKGKKHAVLDKHLKCLKNITAFKYESESVFLFSLHKKNLFINFLIEVLVNHN